MKTRCGLACLSSLSRLNYAEQQLLLCSKLFRHCTAPPVGFFPLHKYFFFIFVSLGSRGIFFFFFAHSTFNKSELWNCPGKDCNRNHHVFCEWQPHCESRQTVSSVFSCFFFFFLDWGHYLYYLWSHPSDKDRNEFFPTELINFLSAWWSPVVMHDGWRSLALSPTIIDLNWQLLQRVCHC